MDYDKYKVDIPEAQSGDWRVEKFTVSEEDAKLERIRAVFSFSNRGRGVPAGDYTRLCYNGAVVMSDTPDEIMDYRYFMNIATGNVLINGLGLGVVLKGVLFKDSVEKVIVNEISEDVIRLVVPSIKDERVTINHADAFIWKPDDLRFNAVWHDIWDNICSDNLESMKCLHRKYGHYLQKPSYQGSWCRYLIER